MKPDAYRPRVYVEEWHQPPTAAGNAVTELILVAGGIPFLPVPGSLSRELSWEELMEFDPEVVVYSQRGLGLGFDPARLLAIEGWNRLSAARAGRVFSIDDSLLKRPGAHLLAGAEILQALIGEGFWGWPKFESPQVRRLSNS